MSLHPAAFLPVNTALWSRAAAAATTAKLTRAMAEGAGVMAWDAAHFLGVVSSGSHDMGHGRGREGEVLLESSHDKGGRER